MRNKIKLLLGTKQRPDGLLAEVDKNYNPTDFKFRVINGNWSGKFVNGDIFIENDRSPIPDNKVEIISDDQEQLSYDYEAVFAKFRGKE